MASPAPGGDALRCLVDISDCDVVYPPLKSESKGTVIIIYTFLRNQLQNIIKIHLPKQRPEYASLTNAGLDWVDGVDVWARSILSWM